jgi:hypothetical protein
MNLLFCRISATGLDTKYSSAIKKLKKVLKIAKISCVAPCEIANLSMLGVNPFFIADLLTVTTNGRHSSLGIRLPSCSINRETFLRLIHYLGGF